MTSLRRLLLLCLAALCLWACDSDSDADATGDDAQDHDHDHDHDQDHDHDAGEPDASKAQEARDGGADAASAPDGSAGAGAAYVLSVIVFGPDDVTNTYVTLQDSLDIADVDTKKGIEFGSQANIAAYGGKLFISSGEAPTITRYGLNEEKHELEEEATISFADYGESSVSVDDTVNTFIGPHKAYLVGSDGTQIVWDPTAMQILGDIPPDDQVPAERGDKFLQSSSGVARGNRLYRTFFWLDWSTYDFSAEQYFAVYDTDKDELISVTPEARCPGLGALAVADEKGNAYFSNWFYNVSGVLQHDKPSGCALRVPAGKDELDPKWTLDFTELTGGHEGAQLSYVADGRALFAAFHQEDVEFDDETSPYEIVSSPNWEVWSLDLATEEAKPVDGIERLGAQQNVFTLDGRTFVFAPNQDYDLTKVYEVFEDGTSQLAFSIHGWSRAFVKLK
jgi:hypothetical protein